MFRTILAALASTTVFWVCPVFGCDSEYAAIAYSESTGRYGYSYSYSSLCAAECAARSRCNAEDARVVVWSRNNWCALALGDGGKYGFGWAGTQAEAENRALAECSQRTTGAYIAASVFSGSGY